MGVACLKLEGRMKRPEYVAVVTGIYRRLLDEKRAAHGRRILPAGAGVFPQRIHRRLLAGQKGSPDVRHPSGERAGAEGAVCKGP